MPLSDRFDKLRDAVWGMPAFIHKHTTILSPAWLFVPQETWTVETIHTAEVDVVFIQSISAEGSLRVVLPDKVVEAIYRQRQGILKESLKQRGKQAAMTRKAKANAALPPPIDEIAPKGNQA